jgi:hypothetical protein
MRSENKKRNDQRSRKGKTKKILPEVDPFTPKPDDRSMNSGNLVNNPLGRTRTGKLHTKLSVTGSDDDGQAD